MSSLGRILVADDEETFLHATGDLLRREGYTCDCVVNASDARSKLQQDDYDLLIADIKMPGNPELELVEYVRDCAEGLQVILVTGYPSMKSAIKSINLPVVAYLVKPIDFDLLLSHVKVSMDRSKIYRAMRDSKRNLLNWLQELNNVSNLATRNPGDTIFVPVDAYVHLTLTNIVSALTGLRDVTEALTRLGGEQAVCRLLNCPKTDSLVSALKDAVEILRKSKSAFKSKELGELRRRLEALLETEKSN